MYKQLGYAPLIHAQPIEAASFSFALNSEKSTCARYILAICAGARSLVFGYTIRREDIENLIESNFDEFHELYFVRSLEGRGIKLLMNEADKESKAEAEAEAEKGRKDLSDNLEKYKNHFKVAVDGDDHCGKASFINAIRGKNVNDIDAVPLYDFGERPKGVTDFYELNKSVVLCKLPHYLYLKERFTCARFDKFDAVVILSDKDICMKHKDYNYSVMPEMAMAVKKAKKPYLIVKTKMDAAVFTYRLNTLSNDSEEFIANEISKEMSNVLNYQGINPCNGKPFLIESDSADKYDLKEVEQLIKNSNFSANVTH